MAGEEARWQLHNNVVSNIEQVLSVLAARHDDNDITVCKLYVLRIVEAVIIYKLELLSATRNYKIVFIKRFIYI